MASVQSLSSSQDFVKALKAPSDPPVENGPAKIEIARQAWDQNSFYAPRKGEVISEWLLSRLLKDKNQDIRVNPVLDCRYWKLLVDVLESLERSSTASSWLTPLLLRIPFAPILITFLDRLPELDKESRAEITPLLRFCFTRIWPIYASKTSVEVFLDCFGTLLRAWKNQSFNEDVAQICIEVAFSFRRSLLTTNAKKKVYTAFIQTSLADWIAASTFPPSPRYQDALEALYLSGVDCLFNLDILRDSNSESLLFDALDKIDPSITLPVVPRLYRSYIQVIKKHRGVLFGQGSSHNPESMEELRDAGMRFFACCQSLISKAKSKREAWRTTAFLLDSIDQENTFSGRRLENESILKGLVHSILNELACNRKDVVCPALECLAGIARLDYRLIEPVFLDILSQLLLVPDTVSPAFQLLDLVLQYHGKTRLVHIYLETMMLSTRNFAANVADPRGAYSVVMHSALLHPLHLDQLAKFTRDFLSPTQTIATIQSIMGAIESHWQEYTALQSSGSSRTPRKKRRTDSVTGAPSNKELVALSFFAAVSLAVVVLSSVTTDSSSKTLEDELGSILTGFQSHLSRTMSKMLKIVVSDANEDCWASQITLLAILRLVYATGLRSTSVERDSDNDHKLSSRMSECLQLDLLPELKLEILRNLLKDLRLQKRDSDVLDKALVPLQPNTASRTMCTTAHMILQRWLPAFDSKASETQLKQMILFFMENQTYGVHRLGDTKDLLVNPVALGFFSAEFWELPNFRSALLAYVDNATKALDNESSILKINAAEVKHIFAAVYSVLLLVPAEYLDRPLKMALLNRAFILDTLLSSDNALEIPDQDLHYSLNVLRVFVSRIFPTLDYDNPEYSNYNIAYLRHLLSLRAKELPPRVISDTTGLATVLLTRILKRPERNGHKEILLLTKSYLENLTASSFADAELPSQCFNRTVDLLNGEYKHQSFPSQVRLAFTELVQTLRERLFPSVSSAITSSFAAFKAKNILEGWRHILIFCRWLNLYDTKPVSGAHATQIFALPLSHRSSTWNDDCTVIFGIILEEVHLYDNIQLQSHLANVVAAYIVYSSACTGTKTVAMDEYLSAACSRLPAEHFNFVLELLADTLDESSHSSNVLGSLVHLATLVLRNPPPNTFQTSQNFTTRCINAFNNHPIFSRDTRSSVLEFLSQRCRDRPAALRLQNVSGIWTLLARISAPSEIHDPHTSVESFYAIMSISTTLIRLRRDLVLLTIPHLAMILRYLIFSMQSPRPNLGTHQTALVSNGLPAWLSIDEPLSAEEAKALCRLLESLTTKTLVKSHSSAGDAALKAESLAKPFSKHAAYVLNAYVDALNNPLCVLPVTIRKELQPGLYALCGMLTDYSRDALMASSTDAGEKASLKSLWKAYEKQRYVGKG